MLTISIDPGVSTGLAWRIPGNDPEYVTAVATEPEQVWSYIAPGKAQLVIYENFAGTQISKYGLHTIRIIGGIRALCWLFNIPIIMHSPQARYPRLREAEEYLNKNKGTTWVIHEKDALAHLLVQIARKEKGIQVGSQEAQSKDTTRRPPPSKRIRFKNIGKYS